MQYTILGLNLLRLLAGNQIADFHTELELIPTDMLDNTFINHPVLLEQYLMEGSYTKIIASRNEVPSSAYTFIMDELISTVRFVIILIQQILQSIEFIYLNFGSILFIFEIERKLLLVVKEHIHI